MSPKNYYYIKPRQDGKISYRSLPTPAEQGTTTQNESLFVAQPTRGQVLDLSFDSKAVGQAAVLTNLRSNLSFGRLILVSFAIVVLYLGGFAVYAQASVLKDDINVLATRGMAKLEAGAEALAVKDFAKATENFTAAENVFTQASQELINLGQNNLYMSGLSGSNFQIITGTRLVESGLNLARGGKTLVAAMLPTFQYFNALGTQPVAATEIPVQIVGLLNTARPELDRAVGQMDRAHSLLSQIDPYAVDPNYRTAVIEAQGKTAALHEAVTVLGTLAQELPQALGFNNPRKYILLNQNSNELRPTGGFIGSFSVITIRKGQIEEVFVDITQRIDGQNPKSKLELPAPLRSVSVTGSFGTRDSNWSPDFQTAAQTFQELYEEGGGGTADGIIAVTPKLIEGLLRIVGPIELPEKGETVTAENFVALTQEYTQFIDNKTENPKAILGELAPLLLEKILTLPASEIVKVNELVGNLLASKDMLLYSRNHRIQQSLTSLNFAGTMESNPANRDFLAVVRANLGARKSSGNVASKITHTVNVNMDKELETALSLSFTHLGTDEFPDGPNKDYIRVYTPLGSELVGADNIDPETKVEVLEENGKTVFGMWVTTNPGETRDVVLHYKPAVRLANTYALKVFKQPGDESWFTSTLRASAGVGITDEPTKAKQLYDSQLVGDELLVAEISRLN